MKTKKMGGGGGGWIREHTLPTVLSLYQQSCLRPGGVNLHPTERPPGCKSGPQHDNPSSLHESLQSIAQTPSAWDKYIKTVKISISDVKDRIVTEEEVRKCKTVLLFFSGYQELLIGRDSQSASDSKGRGLC